MSRTVGSGCLNIGDVDELERTSSSDRESRSSLSGTNLQTAQSASTSTFLTALVFNAAVFGIELGVFTLIRPYFKAIYEPLTYVPPPEKRIQPLSRNPFLWPLAVYRGDYRAIIAANGLDAYFFVRFLRLMAIILVPIWLISWAVLLPVTSVGTSVAGLSGLDKFTFGNVAPDKQKRYAAHLILVYGFTFWIFYHIKREMRHFIITRQQHLIERTHAKSVQANTILITGIPKKFLTQDALFRQYNNLPGGVKKIWLNRNLKGLPDIYDRRTEACAKLEAAETQLLRTAAKLHLKAAKAQSKASAKGSAKSAPSADIESSPIQSAETEVPESERPTHKLGSIPFFGEKVDTIRWARDEIVLCTKLLEEGRAHIRASDERGPAVVDAAPGDEEEVNRDDDDDDANGDWDFRGDSAVDADGNPRLRTSDVGNAHALKAHQHVANAVGGMAKGTVSGVARGAEAIKGRVVGGGGGKEGEYPPMNSAFVTFERQIAAHLAVQVLAHHEPYRMSNKYVEVAPVDVIWANLGLNPYEQKIRIAISYAATAGLIILWAFPVAFVGVISNIHTVCTTASWLAWICKLPSVVVGIISGILPPVLLAVLMMLLPIVLRLLARLEGIPKYTGVELSLMTRFFIFQVVHSFLIVTLSAGILASLNDILNNPTSIPSILAQNLPKASTFFLTYIILQGLSGVAGGFLQIVPLIIYYAKLILFGSTPRSVWSIKYVPRSVAWGTEFPGMTLLVVITLGYSIISPIINGLACATFFAFYQLYKYLFLYAYQQPTTTDTGGLFYPKAMGHIFVGLYVQQICLWALMVVLIVITAGFHMIINNSYGPLLTALPLSLQIAPAPSQSAPAAPAPHEAEEGLRSAQRRADLAAEHDEESYGYAHPAASRPQRTVWIPRDTLGLVCGVVVGDRHAVMDESGKVDVSGGPPDMIQ
ncbi:hypothetical protein BDZ97DRAFT_1824617 [Flammula alnicola]|nr:hypothetical protein BDZ97DRAFT_1824617 [Flammula alnicola]